MKTYYRYFTYRIAVSGDLAPPYALDAANPVKAVKSLVKFLDLKPGQTLHLWPASQYPDHKLMETYVVVDQKGKRAICQLFQQAKTA